MVFPHLMLLFSLSADRVYKMSERTLTQPPARISAGRGMAPSTAVNLSLTKSFIWKEKKKRVRGGREDEMRHNPGVDGGGINVNLWLQSRLDCEEFIFVRESFKATFQTLEPHTRNDLP